MIKNREEWIASTREVSLLPNSPLEQKDGKWNVVQRKETWEALAPRIFDDHLDRFRKIAVEVLRERDPQFDLPPDQRFAAAVYEKVRKHSDELRSGMAETLALLGSFPQLLTSCSHGKGEMIATVAIRELLSDADWVLWASLNTQLPLLAEAAPSEFLDAVGKAISQSPSPFAEIFTQESGGVMGRNYLTGLLWALETLAWHPDYLVRVMVLLGDLAAIDLGGNSANRPDNSMVEILLPWHPQTCADVPKRKAAVMALLREHPVVGWKLLLSLLPKAHGIASGTHKPRWRPLITPDCTEKIANEEYWEQVDVYAQLAIDVAEGDLSRLSELIEHLPNLPHAAYNRLLELLASDKTAALPEHERRPLWEALDALAREHRKFADADWAMAPEAVDKIGNVASKLAPQAPGLLYSRLFTDNEFELFEEDGDYQKQRQAIERKRQEAVAEIIATSGMEGLLEFARRVVSPWHVGFALGFVGEPAIDTVVLPTYLLSPDSPIEQFAAGFVWGRFHANGWEWVDKINSQTWTPEQKGVFLSRLPFTRETWARAERLLGEDQSPYWSKVRVNPHEAKEVDLIFVVDRLRAHGRTRAALQCLLHLVREMQAIPVSLVIDVLRESLQAKEPVNAFDQRAILKLIKWLQTNPETDAEKLLQIEWSYLSILGRYSSGSPKTLLKRLSQDPSFFCQVIQIAFKSKGEELPEEEPSEEQRAMARNAYRLLNDWRLPPGCSTEGEFDEVAFKHWLSSVKKATQSSGHFEVAMSQVGQVLPYSPPDPSGLWIHKAVADALNSKDADAMRSGFTCELFNMRGTHGFTGGEEEKKIAAGYRAKADALESAGYVRIATSVRELAISYERDAERDAKRGPYGG